MLLAAIVRQVRDDDVLVLAICSILANEPRKVAEVVVFLIVLGNELADEGPSSCIAADFHGKGRAWLGIETSGTDIPHQRQRHIKLSFG